MFTRKGPDLEEELAMFEADLDGFVERFLIQDECWVHHFESEAKQKSMQWKHFCSKQGQGGAIRKKDDGLHLLGCKKVCVN